ncbi:MAG: hypothetical protein IT170_05040 [Bryobacterales bacterium]|nr:hypothetical protein [Bryobacterales bacterium]
MRARRAVVERFAVDLRFFAVTFPAGARFFAAVFEVVFLTEVVRFFAAAKADSVKIPSPTRRPIKTMGMNARNE